jgi:hypothetical protein
MAYTPYPGSNDTFENPSIRYSNDGITWEMIPGQPDPIVERPEVGFNSDVNIVLVGDTLYLFNRYADATIPTTLYYEYLTSTDGVTWTEPVTISFPDFIRSATFYYNGTGWECWGHRLASNRLDHYYSSDITTYGAGVECVINTSPNGQWHSEVLVHNGEYMVIIYTNDGENIYYLYSDDGINWTRNPANPILSTPVSGWDNGNLYKATWAFVDNSTLKIWYAAENTEQDWYISAPITIILGDAPETPPSFTISASTTSVTESDTTITLTVTKNKTTNGTYNITIATVDGSASSPGDFTGFSTLLEFTPGETSKTVVLSIKERNDITSYPKTFTVALSNPTGNATLGTPSSITITIREGNLVQRNTQIKGIESTMNMLWLIPLVLVAMFVISMLMGEGVDVDSVVNIAGVLVGIIAIIVVAYVVVGSLVLS